METKKKQKPKHTIQISEKALENAGGNIGELAINGVQHGKT